MANWWTLVLPPTQWHSFMGRFVSISDYTLLPPFFSRLSMCLFPLIFLVNRSFLPLSCVHQLIYNITCLPALLSVGPAPSGIAISTSKVDWSGLFLNKLSVVVFNQHLHPRLFTELLLSTASGLVSWPLFCERCYSGWFCTYICPICWYSHHTPLFIYWNPFRMVLLIDDLQFKLQLGVIFEFDWCIFLPLPWCYCRWI